MRATATPRTDGATVDVVINSPAHVVCNTVTVNPTIHGTGRYVEADFARSLERELDAAKAEVNGYRSELDNQVTRALTALAANEQLCAELERERSLRQQYQDANLAANQRWNDDHSQLRAELAIRCEEIITLRKEDKSAVNERANAWKHEAETARIERDRLQREVDLLHAKANR